MAVNKAQVRSSTADTSRGPSPNIWHDCPVLEIMEDPGVGWGFFDDFLDVWLDGTQSTEIAWGRYKVFNTGSGSVSADETVNSVETAGGLIEVTCDTDNDSGSFATQAEPFRLSGAASTGNKLWFECRLSTSSIATNGVGWLLGLAETQLWTLATGVPFNAEGSTITNTASFIGFNYPEDDTTTLDTVYSDRATSFTQVKDAGITIAANTFLKLGMTYDPQNTVETIVFYANGVPLVDVISSSTLTGLTNLDAGTLGLIFAQVADSSGTAITTHLDWWRCYQLAPL